MWDGRWTQELDILYDSYMEAFNGELPDGYDDIDYDAMTYDEFIGYIKESLDTGVPLVDLL